MYQGKTLSRYLLACGLYLLLAGGESAHAQDVQGNAFNLQLFRPAVDSKGFITVNASPILGHLEYSLGLVGSYANNVLSLSAQGNHFEVQHLLTPQLQAAVGFFRRVELGVSLPVHLLYGSRSPTFRDAVDPNFNNDLSFSAQGIGDLGVHVKSRVLNGSQYPVGLALLASLYTPTGDSRTFLGEGQVTIRPELILDKEFGYARRFRVAFNFGALIRPNKHTFKDVGTTLQGVNEVNIGGAFCAPSPITMVPGIGPAPGDASCGTQLSRSLGTQLTYGLAVSFGAVPQKLELIGELFGYTDVTGERTGHPLEGLLALKVYLAQSSYFEIGGGAGLLPQSITDQGGMTGSPDFRVFLGFIFEPKTEDRDGDGVPDKVDRCPDEPGPAENNGCPEIDRDRDGVLDKDDQCPDVPGPKENHGCPWPDRDHDGVLDKDDACPDVPGPAENNGCPWPDRDGDGVLDKDDACPDEPGPPENHGCPILRRSVARRGSLTVLEPIYFETAKATIKPISYPILNAVADALQNNQQLLLIEIQGHADERGKRDYNMRLTEDRAAAVKEYLIERGIHADRLQSHGYGDTKPLCPEHNEKCWSNNRRVEFVIVRRSDVGP